MKSKPGMSYTVTDILQILSSCKQLGVRSIKVSDIEAEFFPAEIKEAKFDAFKHHNDHSLPHDKLLDEVRLSQLMIDDPLEYEREMLNLEQRRIIDEAVQN